MPVAAASLRRSGRRGRRTGVMVRIAQERILDLFALAQAEAAQDHLDLSDRYVRLARRIGTRYNVRLLPQHRELCCRGCCGYWVEGRTVRTRLRSGHRVRTCLRCGRAWRTPVRGARAPRAAAGDAGGGAEGREQAVEVELPSPEPDDEDEEA